jgi:hypothetical protein
MIVPETKWWRASDKERQMESVCQLELDVWPLDIMNRYKVKERSRQALIDLEFPARNPGQLVPSLATIWVR